MLNKPFRHIELLILLFFLHTGITPFAQTVASPSIPEKFNSYSGKALQEKLFLHTDKEFYVAGELLWLKAYYTDAITRRPLDLSKVAYVELLNEKYEQVLQTKISLNKHESNGSIYLPTTLGTGTYILRAYTNWMKNFDISYFFEKGITVVNTLRTVAAGSSTDSLNTTIDLFPEGGNLVSGIFSKIGFRISNRSGGANETHGYIVNQSGDSITSFSPLKFGIGNFSFIPVRGDHYNAIVILTDGSVINKPLPEIFENGYTLNVNEDDNGRIKIIVHRKKMPGELATNEILLVLHTRQSLKVAEKASVGDNDSVSIYIDKNKLAEGVSYITLFNAVGRPVCERLIFIKPLHNAFLNVMSDKEVYHSREKINIGIQDRSVQETDSPINLSVSVFNLDTLQQADRVSIYEYMWLTSELDCTVESPDYYFSNDPDVNAATDNLMLTHGWRNFNWDDILPGGEGFVRYLPEVHEQLITARIKDPGNEKPVEGIYAYLSIPQQPYGFYVAKSDKSGFVHFDVKDFFGNRRVFIQPGKGPDSLYKIELLKPFTDLPPSRKFGSFQLTKDMLDKLLQKSISMQVQNVYAGDSLRNFNTPVIADTLPFYGLPDKKYFLDDYKRFITMEEVLREYVMEINVGVKGGNPTIKIYNPETQYFYTENVLVLLDNVSLNNVNKIFSYDPLKVRKLEVIKTPYVVGESTFGGVASFSTYDGAFDGYDLDPKLIAIDYPGLQLQRKFYSPAYDTKEKIESRMPDFRNTLLWEPDINTDRNGKANVQFYSSDRKGKFIVIIQGMNENGGFVSGSTIFEVK